MPDCTAFYEPLNERRWFDPGLRGTRVDRTHKGVNDYWREYEGLQGLGSVYRDEWASRHFYMDEAFQDDRLKTYIDALIAHAPSCAVLQFNRADFRLPWLRRHYPETRIVHLYRHPRDQWCSTLVHPGRVPRDVMTNDFEAHDHFYLLRWAQDLKYVCPFLDPAVERHPYRLFYLIWKLSYAFGRMYANSSVAFEDLITSPRTAISNVMKACGLDPALSQDLSELVEPVPTGRWREFAPAAWFEEHEAACEALLYRALGQRRLPVPMPAVAD